MATNDTYKLPRLVLDKETDSLTQFFLKVQRLLIQHPQAARDIVQTFVAEGRHFAETEEGQKWKELLMHSQLARRGRMIWDVYSLDALIETETLLMPSAWLDVITAAVADPDLETILSSLLVKEVQNGNISNLQ